MYTINIVLKSYNKQLKNKWIQLWIKIQTKDCNGSKINYWLFTIKYTP